MKALKHLALGALLCASALSQAQNVKIVGLVELTGTGTTSGTNFDNGIKLAVKEINEAGGISGRPIEIVPEDDATDPGRGAEVVEKFATQHKCDVAFGTLFSHVVMGSAPRAGELKIPYYVVSEGHHVASG